MSLRTVSAPASAGFSDPAPSAPSLPIFRDARVYKHPTDAQLPFGTKYRRLDMHPDERGVFTEVFRGTWDTGVIPVQWNVVSSRAGVLRGVHVHPRHGDYLILLQGRASIGLRDLRRGSPTEGLALIVEMSGDERGALTTPPGVAHGFYFHEPSIHLYSVSHYWDLADELGCYWADPALQIPWPMTEAKVSERDATAQPLAALMEEIERYQPIGGPFPA
jgi:dTDP-4-dehydrorhamnose 3,5-epimerase